MGLYGRPLFPEERKSSVSGSTKYRVPDVIAVVTGQPRPGDDEGSPVLVLHASTSVFFITDLSHSVPDSWLILNLSCILSKYSTKWTDLARKRGTLPSILDTGTNFSRKAAPHLASFIDVL